MLFILIIFCLLMMKMTLCISILFLLKNHFSSILDDSENPAMSVKITEPRQIFKSSTHSTHYLLEYLCTTICLIYVPLN